MTKTPNDIACEALPGWKVVKGRKDRVSRVDRAQGSTPDVAELRRRYLGEASTPSAEAFASASALREEDVEYVVMEPEGSTGGQRRVVVVSGGRAVAVQG